MTLIEGSEWLEALRLVSSGQREMAGFINPIVEFVADYHKSAHLVECGDWSCDLIC